MKHMKRYPVKTTISLEVFVGGQFLIRNLSKFDSFCLSMIGRVGGKNHEVTDISR